MTTKAISRDRYGLTISTASAVAAEKYREAVDLHMSGNAGAQAALKEALQADPQFALAHAALAVLLRDAGRHDEVRSHADVARSLATALPRREKQHAETIAVMANGDAPRSLHLMRKHLAEFPRDAVILLCADRNLFYSGGEQRQRLQLDLLDGFASHYEDDWWFLGQYSFALSECGNYENAERLANRSLALERRNLRAAHTLAHVFADLKEDEKGAAFLGPWLAGFDSRAPTFGHVSWHLALFELGLGHHSRAMEIYRDAVRPAVSKHRSTLNNSASFLWRCMVFGYGPSARQWDELQRLADGVAERPRGEWDDMNAALAFAGAANEAGKNRLIAGLRELTEKGKVSTGNVAIPLVEGAWAFARGNYDEAIRLIEPSICHINAVGGSNAQHEVFWDALIEAYLRTDRFAAAEVLQRSRLSPRPTVRDLFRLGRAQLGCGKLEQATDKLRQAAERWGGADPASSELAMIHELLQSIESVR